MMINRVFFYIILIYFFLITSSLFSKEKVYIVTTIDKSIITNIDVKKETDYLKILNPNLSEIDNNRISEIAKKSLIKEFIKKKEVEKYLVSDQESSLEESLLKNLYTKLNLSKTDFENLLTQRKNYTMDEIKEKLKIEILWNDLIYFKFKNQVKIDEKKFLDKLNNVNLKDKKEYLLSEIIFEKKTDQELNKLIENIKSSISEIGFSNTANIYSISETSKFGGKIGWIDETSLSDKINDELRIKKVKEFTNVIQIGNNFLILMIDDIKFTKISIDKEKELKKLIEYEKNRQLNNFSKIYFNKAKMNYIIDEV